MPRKIKSSTRKHETLTIEVNCLANATLNSDNLATGLNESQYRDLGTDERILLQK
ncbi:hypothetical protein QUB75_03705 [Microcoleus sp. K1-B6]|uniref:hypothetical protein n=1 Tax=unclassified Microcoleus TaxID=2642155 RepID=UPI002FCFA336